MEIFYGDLVLYYNDNDIGIQVVDVVQDLVVGSFLCFRIVLFQVLVEYFFCFVICNLLDCNFYLCVLMFFVFVGFGKICVFVVLVRECIVVDQVVVWFLFVEEDDDFVCFCWQLIEVLGEVVLQFGDDVQIYLQNIMWVLVVVVIESLFGDFDCYVWLLLLVFDDLYLVSNLDIFIGFNCLVQYVLFGLVLVLGMCLQLVLSLVIWWVKGLLLEIGFEELCFGFEEICEYFECSGFYLDEFCLKVFYGQIEGWVVGVYFVSLWLCQ